MKILKIILIIAIVLFTLGTIAEEDKERAIINLTGFAIATILNILIEVVI